jgi:hypothetical protein
LLQDVITGASARAFMVATLNPVHAAESLATVKYAQNYSSLQSSFASRIPQMCLAVRDAQRWLMKAQGEFAAACAVISEGSGVEFTEGSLRDDLVRPNRIAKRAFAKQAGLRWTDSHHSKVMVRAAGIGEEVTTDCPRRAAVEPKDGRRVRTLPEGRAAEDLAASGGYVRVRFPGHHGRPDTLLWFPETALEEVQPPAALQELLRRCQSAETALRHRQAELQEAKDAFEAKQREWMAED